MSELRVGRCSKERSQFSDAVVPQYFRRSAVLILLWKTGNGGTTVLIKQSEKMSKHSAELCFRGGALDQGERALSAALCKTHEKPLCRVYRHSNQRQ